MENIENKKNSLFSQAGFWAWREFMVDGSFFVIHRYRASVFQNSERVGLLLDVDDSVVGISDCVIDTVSTVDGVAS